MYVCMYLFKYVCVNVCYVCRSSIVQVNRTLKVRNKFCPQHFREFSNKIGDLVGNRVQYTYIHTYILVNMYRIDDDVVMVFIVAFLVPTFATLTYRQLLELVHETGVTLT